VVRPGDAPFAARLEEGLRRFEAASGSLPGIAGRVERVTLIEQLVESQRRRAFVQRLPALRLDHRRADPRSDLFDPLKAAAVIQRDGAVDEAFWMAFLFVQFGRSRSGGWRYAREVYGRLGTGRWDWPSVSREPAAFRAWIEGEAEAIRHGGPGGFGNHRKYQSLCSTGETVETYVAWVGDGGSHEARFNVLAGTAGGDPKGTFAAAYRSMAPVSGFGRTARFDYLTTVGRLGLLAIEPDRAYLDGATGPLAGARILVGTASPAHELDGRLVALGAELGLTMDVVEDGVCNWQKSPSAFRPFRD
jgi:hypothetical protein